MPEPEKLHQEPEKIKDRELILKVGRTANEAMMEFRRLEERYALLSRKEELLKRLIALDSKQDEEESEEPIPERDITSIDEVEKSNLPGESKENGKKSKNFRQIASRVASIVLLSTLITTTTPVMAESKGPIATRSESINLYSNSNQLPPEIPRDQAIFSVQKEDTSSVAESEQEGIKDGYGEKGMWLSQNKTHRFNFANAAEVAEVCYNDEEKMMNYVADNEVEAFADYLANIPNKLQPENFKGLGIIETERKLESLSKSGFQKVKEHFRDIMDKALTRRVVINGEFENVFIVPKDENSEATHDGMELVKCVTTEHNLEVTEFYWKDDNGNEIGSMLVKMTPVYDEEGNIIGFKGCLQVLNPVNKGTTVYKGITSIPANIINTPVEKDEEIEINETEEVEENKESEDAEEVVEEETETETITVGGVKTPPTRGGGGGIPVKQWGKEGDPHGGSKVTPSEQVNPESKISKEENAKINQGNRGYVSSSHNSSADAGNIAQAESQTTTVAGGDNNTNAAEERAVMEGNF